MRDNWLDIAEMFIRRAEYFIDAALKVAGARTQWNSGLFSRGRISRHGA